MFNYRAILASIFAVIFLVSCGDAPLSNLGHESPKVDNTAQNNYHPGSSSPAAQPVSGKAYDDFGTAMPESLAGAPSAIHAENDGAMPMPSCATNEGDNENVINGWVISAEDRLSTFAADVDTGSYTLARATINHDERPDPNTIRVEEFVNYFPYNYEAPVDEQSFNIFMDLGPSPFNLNTKLLRIGLKGKKPNIEQQKPANLVFLVDVSGSMSGTYRLDLAKQALEVLLNSLNDNDRIALVTYASDTKVALPSTPASRRSAILDAIYALNADGSTAMGDGLKLAYEQAELGMGDNDVNSRVIVLSDGDANVGLTSHGEILTTIKDHVEKGIYLTTVGFGLGNYRDEMMEQLANNGNGNYYYVDSLREAKRVFSGEAAGAFSIIAKDMKIQVDFNPEKVLEYRLLGFENRDVKDEDFTNDEIDAGELGAGHSVTALYEIKLVPDVAMDDIASVHLRFKNPDLHDQITELEKSFAEDNVFSSLESAPHSFRLASVVAGFAEVLRQSPYLGDLNLEMLEGEFAGFIDRENEIELELLSLMTKVK